MASYKLRLYEDRLGAKAAAEPLPPANRVLYVAEGMASFASGRAAATVSSNSAWFSAGESRASAGADGARVLRYELTAGDGKGALESEHTASALLLESTVELEAGDGYLMRCDRVDIPPGGIAYTHTHQGPGIRCLLQGGFTVETKGHRREIVPGEAWFESGPDPVLAWVPDDRPGYFSRVMILPRALKGKSSIRYVRPEDADRPKLQRYTIFIDEFITL